MFVYERAVRFEEVDAAGIVFFPRFLNYCHEAMEAMLAPLDGGYARLVMQRRIGMPAVHVECDFSSPLRFGDVVKVEVTVDRIGTSSVALRYKIGSNAVVTHTVVLTDLDAMKSIPVPDDVRVILERHLQPASAPKTRAS
jgi:4-hydroxybenzoyl-CoA thioesterase